jgi:hypothetical protein
MSREDLSVCKIDELAGSVEGNGAKNGVSVSVFVSTGSKNGISGAVLHAASGLSVMPVSDHRVASRTVTNTIALPSSCCPVSGNPRAGSTLNLIYQPKKWVVEVYSLRELTQRFVGGFEATEHYPAERNMEGMVELIAQMVADAVDVDVSFSASIVLDCGSLTLSGKVSPQ